MADPSTVGSAFFPYHENNHPFDLPLPGEIPILFPSQMEWSLEPPESQYPTTAPAAAAANVCDHLPVDPVLEELLNEQCFEAGVSGINGEAENPMPMAAAWPATAPPSSCNSCQVLREITHTNGLYISKLEIHGSPGFITHAVLEKYSSDFSLTPLHQTFDFSKGSLSALKQFLIGYFEDCKQEGYIVLQDPLWEFYEALSVGYGGGENLDIDTFFQLPPTNSGNNEAEYKAQKIPLSAQRERTGKLRLKDFAGYLHLPIEEAAKRMNICPTVMKKICRRDGLLRWPYRKIRSIERKISNISKSLSSGNVDAQERERARADILELQQQIATISESFFG